MSYSQYLENVKLFQEGICDISENQQQLTPYKGKKLPTDVARNYVFIPYKTSTSIFGRPVLTSRCYSIQDLISHSEKNNNREIVNYLDPSRPFTTNELGYIQQRIAEYLSSSVSSGFEYNYSLVPQVMQKDIDQELINFETELRQHRLANWRISEPFYSQFRISPSLKGKGASGNIFKVHHAKYPNVKLAIKQMANINSFQHEINIYKHLENSGGHPNVLRYYGHYWNGPQFYIVLEYIDGESFDDYLNRELDTTQGINNNPKTIAKNLLLFNQIVSAVEWCHSNRVVHRDIKTLNTMITRDNVTKNKRAVLIDFDMAVIVPDLSPPSITGCAGTPLYMPPEIVKHCQRTGFDPYDYTIDIWSLGVMLFVICEQNHYDPFSSGNNTETLYWNITNVIFQRGREIQPKYFDEIKRLLRVDPSRRDTLHNLYNTIKGLAESDLQK
jgi:predicted Ser/Thr protein kinase